MFLPAFFLGLFSSLHCIGMCGPIALALPGGRKQGGAFLLRRLTYNLGRIVTYTLLGAVVGVFGETLSFAGFQQGLSIALGAVLLGLIIATANWETKLHIIPGRWLYRLKNRMGAFLRNDSYPSQFNIGILNGFLPCGFVYLGLAGALATGDFFDGMVYMAVFGLGTLPAMLGLSMASGFLPATLNTKLRPILRGVAIVFAFLLILRGMNLGIPYVSPIISSPGEAVVCE
ncbi:MAG: sulfite exporter TauE/SafE family protein [Bacteroidia bacterium]|nr:sulfite exporter TauE/SafE family protein [Bacteroidia bacterium]